MRWFTIKFLFRQGGSVFDYEVTEQGVTAASAVETAWNKLLAIRPNAVYSQHWVE